MRTGDRGRSGAAPPRPRRIVTLTGPAGVGKTRLAFHLAGISADQHFSRVAFVPLASISDALLVPRAIVTAPLGQSTPLWQMYATAREYARGLLRTAGLMPPRSPSATASSPSRGSR